PGDVARVRVGDAVGGLRAGGPGAVLDPVSGGGQHLRARFRQPPRQLAGGARGPPGSVTTPKTGPVSSDGSTRKVDAPVIPSPAAIAACTGAAPRQAGSSEKCRFTHPCTGTSRASAGKSAP